MENALTRLMARGKKNLLNIFFTAGYPNLGDTGKILQGLQEGGVDVIELGIPFSDPLADGPTIQESSSVALDNGMNIEVLFQQLKDYVQEHGAFQVPVLLMGYLNPVLQFGIKDFCERASRVGVAGVIVPDLPLELYQEEFQETFEQHNLSNILLVTPRTSEKRLRQIDAASTGFIYAVSSASTTGTGAIFSADVYLERLAGMQLKSPILVGFNIKTAADVAAAGKHVDGAIIGSEFIRQLARSTDVRATSKAFVQQLRTS